MTGVHFNATLPLAWSERPLQPPLERLRFLEVLHAHEKLETSENELSARLDLQLIWLARLMRPELPDTVPCTIGLEGVRWRAPAALEVGDKGFVAVSLSGELVYLLGLPAMVEGCSAVEGGWLIDARWQFDDAERDVFERLVFSRHRADIRRGEGDRSDAVT
ncbi:hypothetical protein ACTSKR_10855 [Chitinibacteraceae bacterium HSL-7]